MANDTGKEKQTNMPKLTELLSPSQSDSSAHSLDGKLCEGGRKLYFGNCILCNG